MVADPVFLLVDDDTAALRILERAVHLVYAQAHTLEATSVAEARAALQQVAITAILTDYHLPDGTALDILAESRAHAPERKIVVLSGVTAVEPAVLAAGATVFLAKPVDLSRLLQVISTLP